ncbi:uncharacterized protein si:ch211-214j8.12 [Lampris incognitus]|uniref:uncharacterized protein si:ch211-214j8.12 n=1 Tax=Lampris incognitus TaxID=2546036 RepID=UPI0024B512EA|nr:uncharacterized protein si:ch211-214j8.12 [Lampris incognitus]
MPLFRASGPSAPGKSGATSGGKHRMKKWRETNEDRTVASLTQMCLVSLADNMKELWAKDYTENYMDRYLFRHIMGPFNILPGDLVEELTHLLCSRRQLSRAALHLLLVPQLRGLSLGSCPGVVTPTLCTLIAARCQVLSSLDLTGAQQLPSQVQAGMLNALPVLRSLSLAGTLCDGRVIRTLANNCPLLRHLDISRCHFLSPAALLPLGGRIFSSSASPSTSSLCSLDIGFGEEEGDPVAVAAYLLLSLPLLEKVAIEGLVQACSLIYHREFSQTEKFASREGLLPLEEVWDEMRRSMIQEKDRYRKSKAGAVDEEDIEEEARLSWEVHESDCDDGDGDTRGAVGSSYPQKNPRREGVVEDGEKCVVSRSVDERLALRLKDIQRINFASLETVVRLCPDVHSVTLVFDDERDDRGRIQGSMLAAGLQNWSGQLRSLSVQYPGPVVDLLPALQVVGSSLVSLTLEGVITSPHTPLLEVIQACPKLRELSISAEPPAILQEEEERDNGDDQNLPSLPHLSSLTLRPDMSWWALRRVIRCLLSGSPFLERVSLVAVPCPLDSVLQNVMSRPYGNPSCNQRQVADSSHPGPLPLAWLQELCLAHTNVSITTVTAIAERSKRIKYLDLSGCWKITSHEFMIFRMSHHVNLICEY